MNKYKFYANQRRYIFELGENDEFE